jgi:hypothetical protein
MSEPLEIPDRARAMSVFDYDTAARIVVAAELRRMANVCDGAPLGSFWGRDELRMRADELDPQ